MTSCSAEKTASTVSYGSANGTRRSSRRTLWRYRIEDRSRARNAATNQHNFRFSLLQQTHHWYALHVLYQHRSYLLSDGLHSVRSTAQRQSMASYTKVPPSRR